MPIIYLRICYTESCFSTVGNAESRVKNHSTEAPKRVNVLIRNRTSLAHQDTLRHIHFRHADELLGGILNAAMARWDMQGVMSICKRALTLLVSCALAPGYLSAGRDAFLHANSTRCMIGKYPAGLIIRRRRTSRSILPDGPLRRGTE